MKYFLRPLQDIRLCGLFPLMHVCVFKCSWAAQTPLPTLAVPLLQKPIGSMLMMRGFMREKEGRVRGRSHSRMKWEQILQGYSLPQSLKEQLLQISI